ncbi:MAG: isoleucine--tRNA ligase [Pseudomonadota bacterium]|nr:isoleucine--tRNA ligase [Pseudomonadota bacterium]
MAEQPYNFKETLFLPKTNFPMRASLPTREPDWIAHWEKLDIYHELRKKSDGRKVFVLHDGPPYANGHLHIGHALNKILKDFVTRSQQMLGKDARYVPGWDCHGLPIEWKIEEKYRSEGLSKDDVSVNELRANCRKFAEKWVGIQREEFKRLGIIGNWEDPYMTMDFQSEAIIADEFMKFVMNGLLYQGSKPVMWSPVEKTALAEAEIEYHEHKSHTIWVKFQIAKGPLADASVVIWTTTPWTIPSNKAVAFNKSVAYGLYRTVKTQEECWTRPNERFILADKLALECFTQARVEKFERISDVSFDQLAGMSLIHPFSNAPGSEGFWNYDVPMIDGDHVSDDVGTGFVHTAPSHGAEDYDAFAQRGWTDRLTHNVKEDSSFAGEVPFFSGLQVFDRKGKEGKANGAVIEKLVEVGRLLARGRLLHSYPHSWRSKAPVIFRNTPQWFVSIDSNPNDDMNCCGETVRERAIRSIDELVKWTPVSGRNRLHPMISARPDWVLSRQRAWGVPLTCFVRKDRKPTDKDFLLRDPEVNKRIVTVFKEEGADSWFEKGSKNRFLDGLHNPEMYEQVYDILDVWFDSGSTHAFVLRDREDGAWPADLYLEGTDQHRGWFHSSLLQSCGTRGKAPYLGVLTHGFTLDERGMKMSKSLGNTVSPDQVIKQYGADILRLWVAQSDYTTDLRIGPEILKGVADSYRRLRNTLRFLLGSLVNFNEELEVTKYEELPELEKWVLHRVAELDRVVKDGYEKYEFQTVFQQLFQFCTMDLSSFYFDIRKDTLYCDSENSAIRKASRTVLDILFYRLVTWLAPVMVFTTEEVWLERFPDRNTSVHLRDFPKEKREWKDEGLPVRWEAVRQVRKVVTGAIEVERQKKVLGSSLEAAPIIYFDNDELYRAVNSIDFAEICITSAVTISEGSPSKEAFSLEEIPGISVVCTSATGEKCDRCWKYETDLITFQPGSSICKRCRDVVSPV